MGTCTFYLRRHGSYFTHPRAQAISHVKFLSISNLCTKSPLLQVVENPASVFLGLPPIGKGTGILCSTMELGSLLHPKSLIIRAYSWPNTPIVQTHMVPSGPLFLLFQGQRNIYPVWKPCSHSPLRPFRIRGLMPVLMEPRGLLFSS